MPSRSFRRSARLLRCSLGLVLLLLPLWASAQHRLTPHPDSQFWIQGDATVRTFTCVATGVDGSAQLPAAKDSVSADESAQTSVVVQVPIKSIDCGNSRMTSDLQETLKMKEHPKIRFELVHGTMGGRTDSSAQWRRIDALGPLTVAGTKRLTKLDAAAKALDDEHFRLRGCLPIRMTYFGIEPPTKAFGLIKVKNRVEVQYDLLAQTASAETSAPFDTISRTNPPSCDD